jgi:hypothetical protein
VLTASQAWCTTAQGASVTAEREVSRGIAPPFLTSALGGCEWSASRPGSFNPGKVEPGTAWTGDVCTPEPVWTLKWRKIPCPCVENIPGPQPVARLFTD